MGEYFQFPFIIGAKSEEVFLKSFEKELWNGHVSITGAVARG